MLLAHRARTAAMGAAALSSLGPSSSLASAGAPVCSGPNLSIDAPAPSRWDHAIEAIRLRLQQKLDLDHCAQIHLEPVGDEMTVRVVLPDGRHAARRVTGPEKLLEVVEALVVLPTTLSPADRDGEIVPPDLAPHAATPAPVIAPSTTLGLELGVGAEGRLSGAPAYGGFGVVTSAELAVQAWLL